MKLLIGDYLFFFFKEINDLFVYVGFLLFGGLEESSKVYYD